VLTNSTDSSISAVHRCSSNTGIATHSEKTFFAGGDQLRNALLRKLHHQVARSSVHGGDELVVCRHPEALRAHHRALDESA
jgi:hypothetical protein